MTMGASTAEASLTLMRYHALLWVRSSSQTPMMNPGSETVLILLMLAEFAIDANWDSPIAVTIAIVRPCVSDSTAARRI